MDDFAVRRRAVLIGTPSTKPLFMSSSFLYSCRIIFDNVGDTVKEVVMGCGRQCVAMKSG